MKALLSSMLRFTLLLAGSYALLSHCTGCGTDYANRKVRFYGDSVSIMYTIPTLAILNRNGWGGQHAAKAGQAGLDFSNSDNGQNSAFTLAHLGEWMTSPVQVATFNNGIWDCTDTPTAPAEYAQNIAETGKRLKAQGSRVIFFTTTEILAAPGCAEARNAIAAQVLPPLGIEIADLYAFTRGRIEWHGRGQVQNPNDVHFTDAANLEIAKFVASAILQH